MAHTYNVEDHQTPQKFAGLPLQLVSASVLDTAVVVEHRESLCPPICRPTPLQAGPPTPEASVLQGHTMRQRAGPPEPCTRTALTILLALELQQ